MGQLLDGSNALRTVLVWLRFRIRKKVWSTLRPEIDKQKGETWLFSSSSISISISFSLAFTLPYLTLNIVNDSIAISFMNPILFYGY